MELICVGPHHCYGQDMIHIDRCNITPVAERPVEIVERKGRGHPDSICDAVVDAISVALSGEYQRLFGKVLHHNVDKSLLAAGRVKRTFGGGEVLKPMELTIGDRATFFYDDREIQVEEIAVAAAKKWFKSNLRHLDPDRHVVYRPVFAPGSVELADIFSRPGESMAANDTSAAVGYYPLTPTEQAVLDLEKYLNGSGFKKRYPETGEDVKVMALRLRNRLEMTVAMPLLASYVGSEEEYFYRKQRVQDDITSFLADHAPFGSTGLHFNTLDLRGRGLGGTYLTLLGTSAEDADSGQVGRGNRVNGLISLNRPLGTEAAAGKNGVSHVGKIYNVLAHRLAREIYLSIDGIKEVYVTLLSRIGRPVDQPEMASVTFSLKKGINTAEVKRRAAEVVARGFAEMAGFCQALSRGEFPVC